MRVFTDGMYELCVGCEERVALGRKVVHIMSPQRNQQWAIALGTGSTKVNLKKYDRTAPPKSESIITSLVSLLSPISFMSER